MEGVEYSGDTGLFRLKYYYKISDINIQRFTETYAIIFLTEVYAHTCLDI